MISNICDIHCIGGGLEKAEKHSMRKKEPTRERVWDVKRERNTCNSSHQ